MGKFNLMLDGLNHQQSAQISVRDMHGRLIYEVEHVSQRPYEIDLSKYALGIYQVSVQAGEQRLTQKISIQK